MADIHAATSSYSTGTNDTYTTLTDDVDEVTAIHQNGPASAIIGIETILGVGTTLKGSAADLATRIGVAHETSGKLKDFASATKETFPGTVSEGCTGATSFTASQLIRMHASSDVLESAGVTIGAGTSGDVVTTVGTQTITGVKTLTTPTLTTPTIASFTNATHDHTNAAGGGILTGNAASGHDEAWSFVVSGTQTNTSTATATITTVAGAKVLVVCSAQIVVTTSLGGTDDRLRVYRNTTSNIVAYTEMGHVGAYEQGISIVGVDEPGAGTHSYTMDFTRPSAGSSQTYTISNARVAVMTIV